MNEMRRLRCPARGLRAALWGLVWLGVAGCDLFRPGAPDPAEYPIVISAIGPGLEDGMDGRLHLYAVSLDGDAVLLTRGDYGDTYPAFSPDGQRLAFVSSRAGVTVETQSVYIADGYGRGAAPLARVGGSGPFQNDPVQAWETPSWHPASGEVAFSSEFGCEGIQDILVARIGGEVRCLVTGVGVSEESFPSWSPDGSRLVFSSDRGRSAGVARGVAELYVLEVQTGSIEPLTAWGLRAVLAEWSPHGEEIAYLVRGPQGESVPEHGIWIYSLATGTSTRLAVPLPEGEQLTGTVRWLPDSDQLLVMSTSTRDTPPFSRTLYRYDRIRDVAHPILTVDELAGFDWNPSIPAP